MRIVITGATGLIGRALGRELAGGHDVVALTRDSDKASAVLGESIEVVRWDGKGLGDWKDSLEGADAIVHLAGASVAGGRWTERRKGVIVESRVDSAKVLLEVLGTMEVRPRVVVLASAIGFYGSRGDEELDEDSSAGSGFLAGLCEEIESCQGAFESLGIRCVVIRTGIVLDPGGGALPKMMGPFKFYFGGVLGSGRQWMAWISLADEVGGIRFLIENDDLRGVFNLTSPEPLQNRDFMRVLGEVLRSPCWLRVPGWVLKVMLGEMAGEVLLGSQRVYPRKLIASGFEFAGDDLGGALAKMTR